MDVDMLNGFFKERIAAVIRAMQATKILRDDKDPCQIEEGLYLGSVGAARNKNALKNSNVTHVLTVASSLDPEYPNDFKYKLIQILDREDVNISQYFDECFAFIEEARETGGGVLVHCFAGISRSVTVIVAYLMFKNRMSLSEALLHVKSRRSVVCPNSGFMLQLQEFERSLQGDRTGAVDEDKKCDGSL